MAFLHEASEGLTILFHLPLSVVLNIWLNFLPTTCLQKGKEEIAGGHLEVAHIIPALYAVAQNLVIWLCPAMWSLTRSLCFQLLLRGYFNENEMRRIDIGDQLPVSVTCTLT